MLYLLLTSRALTYILRMSSFSCFLDNLYMHLTNRKFYGSNLIRKHSKKLEKLGDLSFPFSAKNWCELIPNSEKCSTIFDYLSQNLVLEEQIDELILKSESWIFPIQHFKLEQNDIHLFLSRSPVFSKCIEEVLTAKDKFGSNNVNLGNIVLTSKKENHNDLSELRLVILEDIIGNVLKFLNPNLHEEECILTITLKSNEKGENCIVCGSVMNDKGQKDKITTADQLYKKRAMDMQLMAQHKYGIQVKSLGKFKDYFDRLGRAAVTLEMLQNKPHKNITLMLNDMQTSNKGSAFIFYNCARLSALFKEFDSRVAKGIYPVTPAINDIDFRLLVQPEEWELLYVYIVQFPMLITNSVGNIKEGIVNPQCLVSFLSNLTSLFSVYYRRVKILTMSKEHLLPVLYARIYLLKALQQVFHICLDLMNIEPIQEM